jgi:type VI secretion system protein ImpG
MTNVVWALKDDDAVPVCLGQGTLETVGLEEEDVILPAKYGTNFFYHLLQEFFTFPEKFMFFRCKNLHKALSTAREKVRLLFPIYKIDSHVAAKISVEDFCLDAVPIVNLFSMKSDPILLDHTQMEYRLSPQENYDAFYEVYDIVKVECTRRDIAVHPFFDIHHRSGDNKIYWTARRDSAQMRGLVGSDMFLSFVTHDFKPVAEDQLTMYAEILATNRDLADDIQKGTILYSEHTGAFQQIRCATHPRSVPYQYKNGDYLWKLIAQLSLNHMSFSDPKYALDALQEILRLHAYHTNNEMVADCIEKIEVVPALKRLGEEHWRGFVRGIEVVLYMKDFDAESYLLFLMSMVVHTFFAHQVGINSFVSLKIVDSESNQEMMVWQSKAGAQKLL